MKFHGIRYNWTQFIVLKPCLHSMSQWPWLLTYWDKSTGYFSLIWAIILWSLKVVGEILEIKLSSKKQLWISRPQRPWPLSLTFCSKKTPKKQWGSFTRKKYQGSGWNGTQFIQLVFALRVKVTLTFDLLILKEKVHFCSIMGILLWGLQQNRSNLAKTVSALGPRWPWPLSLNIKVFSAQ